MKHSRGFSLPELLVLIVCVLLVVTVCFITLAYWVDGAHKPNCLSCLKGIGTALAIYANDEGAYPMLPGCGWDNVPDGTSYFSNSGSPFTTDKPNGDWSKPRSVTSLMFMLVRGSYSPPKVFVCPSDGNAEADYCTTDSAGVLNWDFSSGQANGGTIGSVRNVSYSYQCPITRGAGALDLNGVPVSADSNLVIVADRTPAARGGTFAGAAGSPGAWSAGVSPDNIHFYNSQNHNNGEMMNVLYADDHAAKVTTPNCGAVVTTTKTPDCIFSTLAGPPAATAKDDGLDYGGAVDNTKHVGKRDSYLFGGGRK